MNVTILDTVTGTLKRTEDSEHFNTYDAYWWAEGNGSCDCNRGLLFEDVEVEEFGGFCIGATRYLIVEAEDKTFSLKEYNENYPYSLVTQFIPTLELT